jgi:hypothetical protein
MIYNMEFSLYCFYNYYNFYIDLVGIRHTSHTAHHAKDVVVNSVYAHLGSVGSRNSRGRKDKLENSVIDSGEVARSARLVLFRAKGERVDVDTSIRGTGVVLVRLDNVEVGSFTLREAVLSVKLELSGDDRVLTPTVHVEGGLGKNESSGIRETRGVDSSTVSRSERKLSRGRVEPSTGISTSRGDINGTSHLEKTRGGDESVGASSLGRSSVGVDGVRKSIDGVGVVERLGTEHAEKKGRGIERRAVVNVGIRLDNPDELLDRVVEVELDLVGR